jgi:hypothetical protein
MSFPSLNVGEILAQFTPKQRAYVLAFVLCVISLSVIVTALVVSHCDVVKENNKILNKDISILKSDISSMKTEYGECIKRNEEIMKNNLIIIRKVNELQLQYMNIQRNTTPEESLMLKQMDIVVPIGKINADSVRIVAPQSRVLDSNEVLMMDIISIANKNIKL